MVMAERTTEENSFLLVRYLWIHYALISSNNLCSHEHVKHLTKIFRSFCVPTSAASCDVDIVGENFNFRLRKKKLESSISSWPPEALWLALLLVKCRLSLSHFFAFSAS